MICIPSIEWLQLLVVKSFKIDMPRVCTGEFHDAGFSARIFRKPVTDCFIERLYECGACDHKQFKVLAIQSHASNWDKKI